MASRYQKRSTSGRGNVIDMRTKRPVEKPVIPIICDRMRYYRRKRNMEQKEFARRINASPNTICNWEAGRSKPSADLIPLICEVLDITLADLFGIEEHRADLSAREKNILTIYSQLDVGNQYAVDQLASALLTVQTAQEEKERQPVVSLPHYQKQLAAGIGDPTEFDDESEPFYLYASPAVDKADCVFTVNGDSMEPEYHNGDLVLVQRIKDTFSLREGEVGAFIVGNELYIKQYQRDGLHSFNSKYPVMEFDGDTSVYLIGRVLGTVEDAEKATPDDIRLFLTIADDK